MAGASFDRRLGGNGADAAGVRGGSLGALDSPWISRLRPPPRPGHVDVGGSAFRLGERPARRLGFPLRLLIEDSPAAAAVGSSSGHALRQQLGGAEAARGMGEGEVTRERKKERCDMVAGFGPFHVRRSGDPLPWAEALKRQQKRCEWRLEGEGGGCGSGSYRPTSGAFPGIVARSNHGSSVGDDGFPFLRRMAQLGVAGEVARRERGGKGFLLEEERWRASAPAGRGQREAVSGNAWRLQESSFSRQRGSLCTSFNIAALSDMATGGAAESSQNVRKNQWFHRHQWGRNPKVLDYHPSSSSWPVGNASVSRPPLSESIAGSRSLVGEASCADRHIVVSAQGASYKEINDEAATTGTPYDMRKSSEVHRQVVIKSSFWNFPSVKRAHAGSSFNRRVLMKRALHQDAFVPTKSQKPRTQL